MKEQVYNHIPLYNTLKRKIEENSPLHHVAYGEPFDDYYHDLYNDLFYKNFVFKNNLSNGYFVEIGALDGVINSQSFIFEKHLKWDGIVVEPNPIWHADFEIYRSCNKSKCAVSNNNDGALFECREIPSFSGLKSTTNEIRISDIKNEISVETITLIDLLNKYNAPSIIDWISIDTEGTELDILEHFFYNNKKYKINLINFECNNDTQEYLKITKLLETQPYLKIKNPYLDLLRMSIENGLVKFQPITGEFHKSLYLDFPIKNIDNLLEINFEHFYVHIDFLKTNLHLKKLLI